MIILSAYNSFIMYLAEHVREELHHARHPGTYTYMKSLMFTGTGEKQDFTLNTFKQICEHYYLVAEMIMVAMLEVPLLKIYLNTITFHGW